MGGPRGPQGQVCPRNCPHRVSQDLPGPSGHTAWPLQLCLFLTDRQRSHCLLEGTFPLQAVHQEGAARWGASLRGASRLLLGRERGQQGCPQKQRSQRPGCSCCEQRELTPTTHAAGRQMRGHALQEGSPQVGSTRDLGTVFTVQLRQRPCQPSGPARKVPRFCCWVTT